MNEKAMHPKVAIRAVLEDRGSRYGSFPEHADITQRIKGIISHGSSWRWMSNSQKEALEMVAHKIGRIANGDPNYIDSWVDIIGYVQLVVDELEQSHGR